MTRVALAFMWVAHFLPLRALAGLGQGLGMLLYVLGRSRRAVALTNLALCFPQLAATERARIARAHFRALGRSFLERGLFWWGTPARFARIVRIEGIEHLDRAAGRPVILLAPHFVGFEMGGVRIQLDRPVASMYSKQKNPVMDQAFLRGRLRFRSIKLYSRQDGVRPVVRALREGLPFFYLPDMDFGPRDAVFVPFCGVMAATITALSRLAQVTGAIVVPCITRQLPGGGGYVARLYPPWDGFPGADPTADAERMNAFIEARMREMPEQYYWVHKRFKTRPPGETSPYDD